MDFILVKIRFPSTGEAEYVDDSMISNNISLRYMIEGSPGSILSAENVVWVRMVQRKRSRQTWTSSK